MAFDKKRSISQNIDAIRAVFSLEKEGRSATDQEIIILQKYAGCGGLKFILNPVGNEFSVANNIVQKERFRHFIKVPQLSQFYTEITDYRTAADIATHKK
ncbi:hypothetical protein RAH57_13875 [Chryseobacterium sp. CKR4-1]|uniref:hypothetical protein n=1 Tax=Chryseobacterium sp. CKR4-1 TaxID=3068896 RepID=UPI0027964543|nr:hypothetical protein [Chryseobacterium sp. CKR4-1]MDQ1805082.1 hypothetical protein [Chryseobacterium sp. CKR4-1]